LCNIPDVTISAGQRVKHWRELRGVTQADLAAIAKIDNTRLCKIEKGKLTAKADEIERLAKALELTMPQFYGGVDEASS
jgi:transcriptional regulator with XRE-family HTH domain